jgi:branched-subunit amino acid transport protein AzlD
METERQSPFIRLIYGRNNAYAPPSGPFASDVLRIVLGALLFVVAVLVPRVGVPLLLAYAVLVALRFWRRSRLPYSER